MVAQMPAICVDAAQGGRLPREVDAIRAACTPLAAK